MSFNQYIKDSNKKINGKYVISVNGRSGVIDLDTGDIAFLDEKLGVLDQSYLDLRRDINKHEADKDNPHEVDKIQVGLPNVDNTSDLNKPISTLQKKRFDDIEAKIVANSAGYKFYEKESQLKADKPTTPLAAIALDTKKTWYWDGVKWNDMGLDYLQQLKDYIPTVAITNKGTIDDIDIISLQELGSWYVTNAKGLPKDFKGSVQAVVVENHKLGPHQIQWVWDRYNPQNLWYRRNIDTDFTRVLTYPNRRGEYGAERGSTTTYQSFGNIKATRNVSELTKSYWNKTIANIVTDAGLEDPLQWVNAQFEDLITRFPKIVTRSVLGYEATGLPIYEYVFTPEMVYNSDSGHRNSMPLAEISICCGIHGAEVNPTITTIQFLRQYCEDAGVDDFVAFSKSKAIFKVIPSINPWGTKNRTRTNSNNVDLNRNFPEDWDTATGDKGSAPLSEKESVILDKWIKDQRNSAMIYMLHGHSDPAVAWGVAISERSQEILQDAFEQYNSWYFDSFKKPSDLEDQRLTFIGNSAAGGLDRYAAVGLGISTILLEAPYGDHKLMGAGYLGSRLSFEKIFQFAIKKTIEVHERDRDKVSTWLSVLPVRNGVNAKYSQRNYVLDKIIKDVKVFNANPKLYYRVSYLGIAVEDNICSMSIQADSVERNNVEVAPSTRDFFGDTVIEFPIGQGIKDIKVRFNKISSSGITYELRIDTDLILPSTTLNLGLWRDTHRYYNYYINTDRYENTNRDISGAILERNHQGVAEIKTSSTKYGGNDPFTELQNTLGSPYYVNNNSKVLEPIIATTNIKLPTRLNTSGSIFYTENLPNLFEIPITNMTTQTFGGLHNFQAFTASTRSMNPYGFHRFVSRSPTLINTVANGFFRALIRVPDETTVEQYWLDIRSWSSGVFETVIRQNLGTCHPWVTGKPKKLDKKDTAFWSGTYDRPETLDAWLEGHWVEVSIPISSPIILYPEYTYSLRLYRQYLNGTKPVTENIRNTDIIILDGNFSFTHDIAPMLNKRYNHQMRENN